MNLTKRDELRKRWEMKNCNHPEIEPLTVGGYESIWHVCIQCGTLFVDEDLVFHADKAVLKLEVE